MPWVGCHRSRAVQPASVAKACSTHSGSVNTALGSWIDGQTTNRLGPERATKPRQLVDLAFEQLQRSPLIIMESPPRPRPCPHPRPRARDCSGAIASPK